MSSEKSREWALRATHELQFHKHACMINLTYAPECLPVDLSVSPQVWKGFADRLRQRMGKFRYLMCGEYGDQTSRPHYHALLFGLDFSDDRLPSGQSKSGHALFESSDLYSAWPFGIAKIGAVNWDTARYVASYVNKQRTHSEETPDPKYFRTDDKEDWYVHPEFGSTSRRPGLGRAWIEEFWPEVYPDDFCVTPQGWKVKPPRYYDKWLEENQPDVWEDVKATRIAKVKKAEREGKTTYEANAAREKNLVSKSRAFASNGSL